MKKRKTPRGDGNTITLYIKLWRYSIIMKKRKTPRGDGNSASVAISFSIKKFIMKKRKTPGGDGNSKSPIQSSKSLEEDTSDKKKEKPREGTVTHNFFSFNFILYPMKKRKTPRGDGNLLNLYFKKIFNCFCCLYMKKRKTPRGDGNSPKMSIKSCSNSVNSYEKKPRGDGNYACDNSFNDITFVSWKKEKPQ